MTREPMKCAMCQEMASGLWKMEDGNMVFHRIPLCAEHGFKHATKLVHTLEGPAHATTEQERVEMAYAELKHEMMP